MRNSAPYTARDGWAAVLAAGRRVQMENTALVGSPGKIGGRRGADVRSRQLGTNRRRVVVGGRASAENAALHGFRVRLYRLAAEAFPTRAGDFAPRHSPAPSSLSRVAAAHTRRPELRHSCTVTRMRRR